MRTGVIRRSRESVYKHNMQRPSSRSSGMYKSGYYCFLNLSDLNSALHLHAEFLPFIFAGSHLVDTLSWPSNVDGITYQGWSVCHVTSVLPFFTVRSHCKLLSLALSWACVNKLQYRFSSIRPFLFTVNTAWEYKVWYGAYYRTSFAGCKLFLTNVLPSKFIPIINMKAQYVNRLAIKILVYPTQKLVGAGNLNNLLR